MQFEAQYFSQIYSPNETIDGDYNAKDHALYLKHLFGLVGFHVQSVYDFGFGKGALLKKVSQKLEAIHIGGCDISHHAYKKIIQKKYANDWDLQVSEIHQVKFKRRYDLGICNSVLQYIENNKIEKAIKNMAQNCRYLYFQVPTAKDYKYLKKHLKFEDPYAYARSLNFYNKHLLKHFTIVAYGLLESKKFFNYDKSVFQDEFYRS